MNYAAAASKGSASRATPPPPSANGSKKLNKKKSTEKPKSNGRESAETKSPTSAPPPGFAPSSASSSHTPPKGFSESQQRLLRHRSLFVFRFLVGKAVEVQLVDSSRYVGILDCIDPDDFSIVLKNTQRKGTSHGESFDSGSTVIFKRRQLAHISADGVVDYSETTVGTGAVAGAPGFRTDTEISGRSHEHLYGRELQAASSWLDPQLDTGSLEDSRRRGPSGKSAWNQFEANEKLFGVVSTFDENLYTTKLDRGKLSTEQSREAERIAREIERETTGNFHLQEERGQRVEREDLDEEALYSSVDRKATASPVTRTPNAYIPPALRNASRQTSGGNASAPKSATTSESKQPAATPAASASPAAPSAPAPAPAPAPAATAPPSSGTRKAISFSEAQRPLRRHQPKTEAATSSPKAKAPASATPQKADTKSTAAAPASSTKKAKESKAADSAEAKAAPDASKKSNDGASATAPAPKKGLNPNAKEFKLSAAAPEFTPKFMSQPSATSSPYRQPYQAPAGQMYPPPPMGMGYAPMPEEWMYDGSGMMEDGGEYMHAAYMGYGVSMMPNPAMMQQPVYPPMMPQHNVRMMGGAGGQRVPGGGNYGYPHPHHPTQPGAFNAQGYYQGAAPGAMPYAGAPGSASPGVPPQPPLPREPTPSAEAVSNGKTPSNDEPSSAESSQKTGSAKGASKK
ncbi:hypothetical protein PINS_up003836 [Pythium insidiosum]|nr:hypothetical protein PINS_up003836 [Pythium insidiosum]